MKPFFNSIAAGALLAGFAIAQPQPRYTVIDLGTLPGGSFSQPGFLSDNGLVAGMSTISDGTQHAVLWGSGLKMDLGKPGLNSYAFGVNGRGQVIIQGESSEADPNNENFCAYGTGRKCLAFLWQRGVLTPLPTLGGNNATVGPINSRGEIAGVAENSTRDPQCPPGLSPSGTGPQILDYEAVIWGPGQGEIRELHPLSGDTVGLAVWINDNGQAVGASGTCANSSLPPLAFGPHAVLWDKDGSAHDLGNLGSTKLNMALSINNQGQVVGLSSLTPESSPFFGTHAFLWTRTEGMRDLGTLPGDVVSVGSGINDKGQIVGPSFDADGNPRPYLWQNGVMTDLNTLVPANSPLYLLWAAGINARGEIAGFGVNHSGDVHAFLAIPGGGASFSENRPASALVGARENGRDALGAQRVPVGPFLPFLRRPR
jgi:probable HAF family extracellular repeat protein